MHVLDRDLLKLAVFGEVKKIFLGFLHATVGFKCSNVSDSALRSCVRSSCPVAMPNSFVETRSTHLAVI